MSKTLAGLILSRGCVSALVVLAAASASISTALATSLGDTARQYLDQVGVARGICVLISAEPAGLAIEMAKQSELTLYVQLRDDTQVETIRRVIDGFDRKTVEETILGFEQGHPFVRGAVAQYGTGRAKIDQVDPVGARGLDELGHQAAGVQVLGGQVAQIPVGAGMIVVPRPGAEQDQEPKTGLAGGSFGEAGLD